MVTDPGTRFVAEDYPMPPGWREFVRNEEALVRAHREAND